MIVVIALSSILGLVFLASAFPKLRRPKGFVLTVLEYRILPLSLAQLYGWSLPVLECLLALLLLSGVDVRIAAIALCILLTSFIIAVSINIVRRRDLECNCFGNTGHRKIGMGLLFQDCLLLIGAVILSALASTWEGIEAWSVFSILGFSHKESIFPIVICVTLTIVIIIVLRNIKYIKNLVTTQKG